MRLNKTTDYAVRILVYLAKKQRVVDAQELSQQLGVPMNYITRITALLKARGYIESQQGTKGGYRIKAKADKLSLKAIVATMEGGITFKPCKRCSPKCALYDGGMCLTGKAYEAVQTVTTEALSRVTVADLIA